MATTGINTSVSDLSGADLSGVLIYIPVNVGVDVSGNVELFGEKVETSNRLLVSGSGNVSAAHLAAFIQYRENATDRDEVDVSAVAAAKSDVAGDFTSFVSQQVTLDSGYADWWNDGNNKNVVNRNNYTTFTKLSEFLLAQIAYDVLGHPMAKAGIANDTAIIAGFEDPSQGIGAKIADAIENAGSQSTDAASGTLKMVYRQLFRMVPSRFQAQDSEQGSNGPHETLPKNMPFVAGDKIRFELTLNSYTVTTFSANVSSGTTGVQYSKEANGGLVATTYGSNTYTVEITLVA